MVLPPSAVLGGEYNGPVLGGTTSKFVTDRPECDDLLGELRRHDVQVKTTELFPARPGVPARLSREPRLHAA